MENRGWGSDVGGWSGAKELVRRWMILRPTRRTCSSFQSEDLFFAFVKPFIHRVERRGKQTGQTRISSRASICSSFLVRAMKQEHQDSDQELCRNDSIWRFFTLGLQLASWHLQLVLLLSENGEPITDNRFLFSLQLGTCNSQPLFRTNSRSSKNSF